MNQAMWAIIKKDLRGITANRQLFGVILIVPLVLTVVLPSVFVLLIYFLPQERTDFERMLALLPVAEQAGGVERTLTGIMLNYLMPIFFLLIPIMASSVTAASSFVGEKEKHTLETLLYCPLSLRQIFRAKVSASFLLSMVVSYLSFFAMLLVLETEMLLISGVFLAPTSVGRLLCF